eukprot:TRINITY_DN1823_c0_g1_i2.p1 TRINITY_DN1823_c0_g1~~TRINITY_DN1823_c0_g1_i2.p1  ORF type:complete len:635 (-),score=213.91 TRINITY_DN1823_c0_g1_i2:466-2370(-)
MKKLQKTTITQENHSQQMTEKVRIFDLGTTLSKLNAISIEEGEKHEEITENNNQPMNEEHESKKTEDLDSKDDKNDNITFTSLTAPGVKFSSKEERALHYKSDWHRWNLKLRGAGLSAITKEEFDQLIAAGEITELNLNYEEDGSGSEEDPQDKKPLKGSNRVSFITKDSRKFTFWKNVIIPNPNERVFDLHQYLESVHTISQKKKWAVFMSSGGHFAGGIFDGAKCIKHKTFHRYIVRKKQGGLQSTKDNQSATSQPKSAGASIRRHNEKRFREDITNTLTDWKSDLDTTDLIFVFTPSQNWYYFVLDSQSNPSGFDKDDRRIRNVPFTVGRPTLVEVKRIHHLLSTVEISAHVIVPKELEKPATQQKKLDAQEPIVQEVDQLEKAIIDNDFNTFKSLIESSYVRPAPTKKDKSKNGTNSTTNGTTTTSSNEDIVPALYLSVAHNRIDMFEYLLRNDALLQRELEEPVSSWFFRTALHRAAHDGLKNMVTSLLDVGANPGTKDILGKLPYTVSNDKQMRDLFRKYAAQHPDKWNWSQLGIEPLTKEMEDQKKKSDAEKKKRKKKQQKLKKQQQKNEDEPTDEPSPSSSSSTSSSSSPLSSNSESVYFTLSNLVLLGGAVLTITTFLYLRHRSP